MAEHGIEDGANNELLHIVEIPEKFEDYSNMILDKGKRITRRVEDQSGINTLL